MTAKKNGSGSPKIEAGEKYEAIVMLKADHREVRKLLNELEDTEAAEATERSSLLASIASMVRAHSMLEEELFYPAYLEASEGGDDEKLFYEAAEEHHVVDLVLAELEACDPATPEFAGKGKVLKDLIEHHAEEEETEMFPKAAKLIDREELEALGEKMRARKTELEEEHGVKEPASAERNVSSSKKPAPKAEKSDSGRAGR